MADIHSFDSRGRGVRFGYLTKTPLKLGYAEPGKRWFEVIAVVLSLPFVLPLIGCLALMSRLEGGSAFYGHVRIGKGGRAFKCWKIRTMVPDAAARLQRVLREDPQARAEWAAHRKLRADPRVTGLGRFLRATSLDELPQLWNVLRGEMSLVGPRPVTRTELHRYGSRRVFYTAVRPGITGLWQVSGRNGVSYRARVDLDVRYAMTLSFAQDLTILRKTVGAVLRTTGI